jgi:hypothetical protein
VNQFTPVTASTSSPLLGPDGQPLTLTTLPPTTTTDDNKANPHDEIVIEVNKCGCSDFCVKIMIFISVVLFIIFSCIGLFVFARQQEAGYFFLIAILFLIISVVGCNLLCCACCKPPKGADE